MASSRYTDLILDVGGVLISYSGEKNTALSSQAIKYILDSRQWHAYEWGKLSQQQCYDNVTTEFSLAPVIWKETVRQLESTLQPNRDFINAIMDIKAAFPSLRIHAFSNASAPEFETLRPMLDECAFFETVISSASSGWRKPVLDPYRNFFDIANVQAHSAIFVDDRSENVVTAQSLRIQGILFGKTINVVTRLHNLLGDFMVRGMGFWRRGSNKLWSETNDGTTVQDIYTQLLILECIGDRSVIPATVAT